METQAPDITNSATVGQVIIPSPVATPTLSPAGPPMVPPFYPISTALPTAQPFQPFFTYIPTVESIPKRYIGKPLVIYGYGPAYSSVSLNGIGIFEKTTTDNTGYFVFETIYSYSLKYPDLCLQATDIENRVSQPSCIPGLPESSKIPSKVGPVLLSPTLSLDSNNVLVDQNTRAQGITTPKSKVQIHISRQESNELGLAKSVYAYEIPTYQVESNEKGEFEFSLPTQSAVTYKLFASNTLGENLSSKSNTLTFSVLTPAQSNWNWFKYQFTQNKIAWFIVLEIIIMLVLAWAILKNPSKKYRRKLKSQKLAKSSKPTKKGEYLFPEVGLKNKYLEFFKKIRIIS